LTVGRQFAAVEEARTSFGDDFPVAYVRSWGRQPELVRALTENITAALEGFPPAIRGRVPLLFTAHSLPARMAATGDPYPDEVRATMDAVCKHLGERTARLAYHSQGRSGEWLGPDMRATLEELAGAGHRQVLVVPVGFVTDHVDVLYDVDIELRAVAARKGIQLERISMLNSDRRLVETLATVVRSHLGPHTG
jgi:ferrochelatase